jgi:hypothetical protein
MNKAIEGFHNNPLVVFLTYDEKFLNVLFYLLASVFGTFYDQKLFLLYILYYFMEN